MCHIALRYACPQNILTFTPKWWLVDASGVPVGRLATQLTAVLQGKNKPIYHPSVDVGDYVVVINAEKIALSGKKWDQKVYRHHTGYPGGLKSIKAKNLLEKKPTEIIRKATYGMLPKNDLRLQRIRKLHVFPTEKHPFADNVGQNIITPTKTGGKMYGKSKEIPLVVEMLEIK
ncbi:50S ribosomal protein L13 [Sphaeroforma arctica JP610]|uniref:50S ribosomal protein L13 n=1 Tax=Sphaeroforma arctica JP610 TaxID=667725 RepID=A0A0L0FXW4_9EUKA|nr:50S ribosomal protein L13 [Sphaeroforma arctica JP610]KNC81670.1 50S ribosomal protein L13 [Sphaeroforma arctica JP610]|eukprot:XP_014155572.1 50S ribosomal protein L13 [Sphaeroforma arctica JP610]